VILNRSSQRVKTKYGTIGVKIVETPGEGKRATPEYEEIKKLAERKRVPLKVLYDEVLKVFKGR